MTENEMISYVSEILNMQKDFGKSIKNTIMTKFPPCGTMLKILYGGKICP